MNHEFIYWSLSGFCGYFDTILNKIETNVGRDCTLFADPCPAIFNSSDLYKCKCSFVE